MLYKLLKDSIKRHLEETLPLIEQLVEVNVRSKPVPQGRAIGEVVLHLIRSIEFYVKGVVMNQWETFPYSLETYDSAEAIVQLAREVFDRVKVYVGIISSSDIGRIINSFSRPATVAEIILEMLEHSIHHRGQITIYYRLLGMTPEVIQYII